MAYPLAMSTKSSPVPFQQSSVSAASGPPPGWNPREFLLSHTMLKSEVQVVFDTGVVDMVGAPCTGTSYSFLGAVVITLPSVPSEYASWQRQVKDVTVIVEGQSEYWDATGRHMPMRLFAYTLPLIPIDKPRVVPSYNPHASNASSGVQLCFPFDLRVPGWIPPTMLSTFTTNLYGVVAQVRVGWKASRFGFSGFGGVSCHETVDGHSPYTAFIVRRHRVPTALRPTAPIRDRSFTREQDSGQLGKKLEFLVVLPEWIDMHADNLDLSLRVRVRDDKGKSKTSQSQTTTYNSQLANTRNDDPDVSGISDASDLSNTSIDFGSDFVAVPSDDRRHSTYITELGMEVEECGRFSSHPVPWYTQQCPIPQEQPSLTSNSYRLMGPSSRPSSLAGMRHIPPPGTENNPYNTCLHRLCLLSDEGTQRRYQFPGNGKGIGSGWRRIRFVLPMPKSNTPGDVTRPTPDCDTPFMKLRHILRIRVVLKAPGFEEPETILVEVPIRFGSAPETLPTAASNGPPPYISVFHENGELRDCDPLPLYPGSPPASTASPLCSPAASEAMVLSEEDGAPADASQPPPSSLAPNEDEPMVIDHEASADSHSQDGSPSGTASSSRAPSSMSMASGAVTPENGPVKLPTMPGEWNPPPDPSSTVGAQN